MNACIPTAFFSFQVGRFPLTDKTSLYILLPPTSSEESFSLMEKNMNHTSLSEMVSEMSKITLQTAEVTLPKIKLAVTTTLGKLLRNLGKCERAVRFKGIVKFTQNITSCHCLCPLISTLPFTGFVSLDLTNLLI